MSWGISVKGGVSVRETPPAPVNGMTDACEDTTLPQTSCAGGKDGDGLFCQTFLITCAMFGHPSISTVLMFVFLLLEIFAFNK